MKTFKENIELLKRSGAGCAMVVTKEEKSAQDEIIESLTPYSGEIYGFSVASGVKKYISPDEARIIDANLTDPRDLMENIMKFTGETDNGAGLSGDVLILPDFAEYLDSPVVRRQLKEAIFYCRTVNSMIILIVDKKHEFPEIMSEIKIVDHDLPDKKQTMEKLNEMCEDFEIHASDSDKELFVESLSGLTSGSQEQSIASAILESKKKGDDPIKLDNSILIENKKADINERYSFLKVVDPDVSFDDVQGLDLLKDWVMLRRRGFSRDAELYGIKNKPKGFLLSGPPGTGKSMSAKAIADAWQYPLLRLDVGGIFTKLLGESEENIRTAINIAERMEPCILWIDEIDQAFGGGGGDTDGGTSKRITGTILTWLAEKKTSVFVIATANSVDNLPAQMIRKGRFDEIFSVNVPSPKERKQIFEFYLKDIKNDARIDLLVDMTDGYVPAEIEAIVGSAHYRAFERDFESGENNGIMHDDLVKEINECTPLIESMRDQFDRMKNWSEKNARPATSEDVTSTSSKRKLG